MGIDATTLEANAAMRSIVRRDNGESYEEFLKGLAKESGIDTPTREDLALFDRVRKDKASNKDWVNPHDGDGARPFAHGSHATLLAVDGSTTEDIPSQALHIPSDATHLVLSAGGNDAIMNSDLPLKPLDSTAKALAVLAEVAQGFEKKYRRAVGACRKTRLPLTICTIYNGNFRTASMSDSPLRRSWCSTMPSCGLPSSSDSQ